MVKCATEALATVNRFSTGRLTSILPTDNLKV